jgi:uncharacterized protein (DUF885 family)
MRIGILLVVVLSIGACHRSDGSAASTTASADAALATTLTAYAVEFLRRNPTTNTYLGGAGLDASLRDVDGMLRDHSAAVLEQEDRWLADVRRSLEAVDEQSLGTSSKIDRQVALAQIRFLERQHQLRRYQERALDTYLLEPFRAVDWQLQGMTPAGEGRLGTEQEWTLLTRRVRAIPTFLATAQQQLLAGVKANNVPDRRMIERDGLGTSAANGQYFADTLPRLAADRIGGANRPVMLADLIAAAQDAAAAYRRFREFVIATYFDDRDGRTLKTTFAGDRFAFGAEEYNWALRNNFRIESKRADQLFEEALPIVEDTANQMVTLARTIAQRHGWRLPGEPRADVRAVFDQLSKDYPKSDAEMVGWYRDSATRLVEYGRKTGMFDVPADYRLEVTETPPPLQASIDGAAYYPAPPFKTTGTGRFYVTPTHNDLAALQSNNRASIADLAAHEGFPGHDWYYKVLTVARGEFSAVRWLTPGAVEDSSAMWEDSMPAEGWGLYAEALMAEPQPGAPKGFYTDEERLYQLQGKLYRDLRVRIDTGIHIGRLTYDDAVTLFSEVVDFLPGSCAPSGAAARTSPAKRASCAASERAIFRYSKWPTQAVTYRLGRDEIYAMREEAQRSLGDRFSPKTFHLLFIRQGTIPSGYFRETLLDQLRSGR